MFWKVLGWSERQLCIKTGRLSLVGKSLVQNHLEVVLGTLRQLFTGFDAENYCLGHSAGASES